MTTKPMKILHSDLTGKYYATKSYKWINEEKGHLLITGKKEDVTEEIESIVSKRITQHEQGAMK